jgi:hypothetical protein
MFTLLHNKFAVFLLVLAGVLLVGLVRSGAVHIFSYAGPTDSYFENGSVVLQPSNLSPDATEQSVEEAKSIIEKGWQGGHHATLVILPQELDPVQGRLMVSLRLVVPEELKRILWDGSTNQYVAEEANTDTGDSFLALKPQFEDRALELQINNRFGPPNTFHQIP